MSESRTHQTQVQLAGRCLERLSMTSLARWCYRHRMLVVILWIVGLVGIGGASQLVGSKFSSDFTLPDTESTRALNLITAAAPAQSGESVQIVAHATDGTLDDAASKAAVRAMLAQVAKVPEVVNVGDLYQAGSGTVNKDRTIGFVTVQLDKQASELDLANVKSLISTAKKADSGSLEIALGGNAIQFAQTGPGGGGVPSELIGVLAAAVILFLAFGSIFTMFLPILTALLALGIGASVIGFLTHAFSIAEFGPVLAALIGLGVGVDYALFIVSRHRVNLRQGHDPEASIVNAVDTSGRAVLFAGITVCIAILGLLLLGVSFLYGLALSVVVVVLLTMLAALTFLPAMLGFVKFKALSKKQRRQVQAGEFAGSHEDLSPGWYRWAQFVARRPFPLAAVSAVLLLVLAIPTLSLRLGTPDAGGDPQGTTSRQAYDLLAQGFGPGFNGPLQLVAKVDGQAQVATLTELTKTIAGQPDVASVTPVTLIPNSQVAISMIYPSSSPQDEATTDLIKHLRADVVQPFAADHDLQLYVGGVTAIYQDFSDVLSEKLPLFVGVVVLLSFLLLTAVFRSLLVPLVASVMNLLSAGAAFGVVVAIFQWGWGAGLIGVERTGPIIAFLPVMAFAILFGLSMDYEVFLVSRMYEEWHRTKDNDAAVALGQAETGRVITAAAAIMIAVFGSFVFGGDSTIKLFGIALASAVLLDALIIRTVLVPAIMHMLGARNWYLPDWLDRVLPKLNVEGPQFDDDVEHESVPEPARP